MKKSAPKNTDQLHASWVTDRDSTIVMNSAKAPMAPKSTAPKAVGHAWAHLDRLCSRRCRNGGR